jgi:hypothetical protein
MDAFGFVENVLRIPVGRFADAAEGATAFDSVSGFSYQRLREGWIKASAAFLPPGALTASLFYVSDGDANGVFYFAGTNYGAVSWTNPFTAARLGITSLDNTGGDLKQSLVDRVASSYSTSTGGIVFDLGVGKALLPTSYSYRYRNDVTTFSPTAWKVQGSNDNSAWTDLDTVTGQTPGLSAWVSRT